MKTDSAPNQDHACYKISAHHPIRVKRKRFNKRLIGGWKSDSWSQQTSDVFGEERAFEQRPEDSSHLGIPKWELSLTNPCRIRSELAFWQRSRLNWASGSVELSSPGSDCLDQPKHLIVLHTERSPRTTNLPT